jgi:hypothetical protein
LPRKSRPSGLVPANVAGIISIVTLNR